VFLAALALIAVASPQPEVWRCYRQVYDLALYRGEVVAATSGGAVVRRRNGVWEPLAGSPSPLRRVRPEGDSLLVTGRTDEIYALRNGRWELTDGRAGPSSAGLPTPSAEFEGKVLSSLWGSKFLVGDDGKEVVPRNPEPGDFDLLATDGVLYAATENGVYRYRSGIWALEELPSDIPTVRPHGYAEGVIGGIDGLFLRNGNGWQQISRDSVRQVLPLGKDVWVLYGSGAVDKLQPKLGRMAPDVLHGSVRRPWASCLAVVDKTVLMGGQGGWVEQTPSGKSEHYIEELREDVVTAAAGRGPVRWIGTQVNGLLRFGEGPVKRWNPGLGLKDVWITALLLTPEGLWVATAGQGLFLLKGETIEPVPSPTQRPRHLALWNGHVVVGGMDGAWIRQSKQWRPLETMGEETTAILAGKRLVVCTASGIFLF
jgi:hypothetical protein